MRTQLLSHNKTAYQKVVRAFETSDRTCVVHPTGTGKSYLIAAVSESYKRVLILGPNVFVDQVHDVLKWRKDGVEYMTYSMLLYTEEKPTGYDLICLDEFHRAGAPEWGEAVDKLLEVNADAKIFGTTATPVRYLDDERDMADELFHGNVASHISIGEAWSRAILPIPTYVTGLFEFTKTAEDAEARISKSRRIDAKEKRQRMTRINNLRLDWERSQGMPQIIRKHIDKDARRIIIFCGNIEHLKDMQKTIEGWFKMAGFTVSECLAVHSYMTDKELKDTMEHFEDDTDTGIKLMLSVNMLNEGVHIPRVNAVLLLRTTSSKIIYMQQIGRCLTAANTERPVILDMVDNITTVNLIHGIKEDYDWYEHQKPYDEKDATHESREFIVYDYAQSLRDVIDKLVPKEFVRRTTEERIQMVREFCEQHDRLPRREDGDPYRALCNIYLRNHDHPDVVAIRERWGRQTPVVDYESRLQMLMDFCDKELRLPGKNDGADTDNWNNIKSNNKHYGKDPRVKALQDKYGYFETDERLIQHIVEFEKEHGRLPSAATDAPNDERNLRAKLATRKHLHGHPVIRPLLDKYTTRRRTMEEKIQLMQEFTSKYGRCPYNNEAEKEYYSAWFNMLSFGREDTRVKEMYDKYRTFSRKMNDEKLRAFIKPLEEFVAEHHRCPSAVRDESGDRYLYSRVVTLRKTYADNPIAAALLKKMESYQSLRDQKTAVDDADVARRMKEFVLEHHRMPCYKEGSTDEEARLHNQWNFRKNRICANDPEMQALVDQYARKFHKFDECYQLVRDWAAEHGKLPGKADKDVYHQWTYLRDNHRCSPEVHALMERYGYRHSRGRTDVEWRLDKIEAFVNEHGRLPSTAHSDEIRIARWWHNIKRKNANLQRVTALMERFPIQNR